MLAPLYPSENMEEALSWALASHVHEEPVYGHMCVPEVCGVACDCQGIGRVCSGGGQVGPGSTSRCWGRVCLCRHVCLWVLEVVCVGDKLRE